MNEWKKVISVRLQQLQQFTNSNPSFRIKKKYESVQVEAKAYLTKQKNHKMGEQQNSTKALFLLKLRA